MERLVHLILSVFHTRFSDSDGSDELIGNLLHAMVLLLNRVCNESHIRQQYGITLKKYAFEKKDPARSAEETP